LSIQDFSYQVLWRRRSSGFSYVGWCQLELHL